MGAVPRRCRRRWRSRSAPIRRRPGWRVRAWWCWPCATTQSARSPDADAGAALWPLVEGTCASLSRQEPAEALAGPVARGDVDTIARHVASLTGDDAALYRTLGRAALELARKRGMDDGAAAKV